MFFFFFQNYFGDAWNVFDFIIVLGSFIDIIYTEVNVSIHAIPLPQNLCKMAVLKKKIDFKDQLSLNAG